MMHSNPSLPADLEHGLTRIAAGTHHDPHAVLGLQRRGEQSFYLAYVPGADRVLVGEQLELRRLGDSDAFTAPCEPGTLAIHPPLIWWNAEGVDAVQIDPYSFEPSLDARQLESFGSGRHTSAWQLLGAHELRIDDIQGVRFAVWAPNAERVSVVGPICLWDGRRYPMRSLGASGVWELFIPGIAAGELYKFELRVRATGELLLKSDPYARATERRPDTASMVASEAGFAWRDADWLDERSRRDWLRAPMSVYELHLGSWQRNADGGFLNYREIAEQLVPYVTRLGFTHIELMPITEHPLDDSWGYQTSGFFAPTSRFGAPDDLRHLIDRCHAAGIGVLLDWVPGHFPRDAHALANFDGTALYEYPDPRKAEHKDWGTLVFNYERHEVRSFLISSARYWIEEFHFDGLRVDAVASMLYLDFSKREGDFVPNRHGGNHNLEAVDFLRELNSVVHADFPGVLVIAEESTDWPLVSRPTHDGGLGFSMKWNMGWMHDTLKYFALDPLYRSHHHELLTFGMMYAHTENFVLPLSHDEVVHLKKPLIGKMPGDEWQQFASLRLLFIYMWTFPGKKLLFMGGEFAQTTEWDFSRALDWALTEKVSHAGMQRLVGDLNALYRRDTRLHALEFEQRGFRWLDCEDRAQSVLSYLRFDARGSEPAIVVLNFTPVPRYGYRIGVPGEGDWHEALNSDAERYGGSNVGNLSRVQSSPHPAHGHPWSLELTLPPLGGIVLVPG